VTLWLWQINLCLEEVPPIRRIGQPKVSQPDCQQTVWTVHGMDSMLCFLAPAMHGLTCGSCIDEKGIRLWPHSVCSAL